MKRRVFVFLAVIFTLVPAYSSDLLDMIDDDLLLLYPEEDRAMVIEASIRFNIPLEVLVRQDFTESSFDKSTVYHQNDGFYSIGYKQINKRWMDYMIENYHIIDEPFDETNEKHLYWLGCNYLVYLIDRFDSAMIGLTSYNVGETKVALRREEVPQRGWDYAYFILTGVGRGVYYNRMLEFNRLLERKGIDISE